MTVDEANQALADADLLVAGEDVTAAIGRLAGEIASQLSGANPVLLCVMNGGLIFAGQLLPGLAFPLEFEYCHATRYGRETTGAGLDWIVRPRLELRGRTVLLLDDILDEGITLAAIADYCRQQGAARVMMAVLVDKRHDRKVSPGFRADFTGLETEDRFLFGFGLDYKGYWRNAPGIYAVKGL
jgi:hypoxanthine phosphoribosyltransferase